MEGAQQGNSRKIEKEIKGVTRAEGEGGHKTISYGLSLFESLEAYTQFAPSILPIEAAASFARGGVQTDLLNQPLCHHPYNLNMVEKPLLLCNLLKYSGHQGQ